MIKSSNLIREHGLSKNGLIELDTFQECFEGLLDHIAGVVVTSRQNIRLALLGLFAQGHILLEDLPGVGKTLLAKTIATSVEGEFSRIQFTPDLLPSDITGTSIFDMGKQAFQFMPGPIFANVVVADELNRTGPRTQSALLEAMAEGVVSADGTVWPLPRPFFIIATQNLVETHGTFPLPNSQLDRFMLSMTMGLPSAEEEVEILRRAEHGFPALGAVLTRSQVLEMQQTALTVATAPNIMQYIANLAGASRTHRDITLGVSPRASASLLRACQAWAAFAGRTFVVPEDIQELAPYLWGHRVVARSLAGSLAGSLDGTMAGRDVVHRLLESVPVPL